MRKTYLSLIISLLLFLTACTPASIPPTSTPMPFITPTYTPTLTLTLQPSKTPTLTASPTPEAPLLYTGMPTLDQLEARNVLPQYAITELDEVVDKIIAQGDVLNHDAERVSVGGGLGGVISLISIYFLPSSNNLKLLGIAQISGEPKDGGGGVVVFLKVLSLDEKGEKVERVIQGYLGGTENDLYGYDGVIHMLNNYSRKFNQSDFTIISLFYAVNPDKYKIEDWHDTLYTNEQLEQILIFKNSGIITPEMQYILNNMGI